VTSALVGLFGVNIGLAIARGYGFWAGRRSELAEAAISAASLAEELRKQRKDGSSSLTATWIEHRRWLVIHLSPQDYRVLTEAIGHTGPDAKGALR
jgi:hypothetical protein